MGGREGEPTSMNDDSKRAKESHPHAQGHDEKATLLKYIRQVCMTQNLRIDCCVFNSQSPCKILELHLSFSALCTLLHHRLDLDGAS